MQSKHNPSTTITIGLAGDTMLGRLVGETLMQMPPEKRATYPWGNTLPILHSTNLNLVNLETALTVSTQSVPKVFNYKANPDIGNALKAARIDVVNLANNHILDFDVPGMQETIKTLDDLGIHHVGAGNSRHIAQLPVIINKNGINIGIVGFTDNEPGWLAEEQKPGINYVRIGDIKTVERVIDMVRPAVDLLILSIHWGPNMQQRPTQEFIEFAHQIIDAGVDIIHGHSAHIFQGVEIYKNKLILYDTGDFVDDYAVDPLLRNDQSFIFLVTATKSGARSLELIPTKINDLQVNLAQSSERDEIVNRMEQLSAELGTTFTKKEGRLYLPIPS